MISTLITLIIYCVILGLLLWLVNYVADQFLPEPIKRIVKVVAIVVIVIIIILLLLQLVGGAGIDLPRLGGLNEVHPYIADIVPVVLCQSGSCTASL